MNSRLSITLPFCKIPIVERAGLALLKRVNRWAIPTIENAIAHNPKGTFLDVGANLGEFLLYVHEVNKSIPCVAVEPNPFCVSYMHKLIKAQGWWGVDVTPCAAGLKPGILHLCFENDIDVDSSAHVQGQAALHSISVPALPLCMMPIHGPLSLVKIDVEGSEFVVLEQLLTLPAFLEGRPWVLFETVPNDDTLTIREFMESALRMLEYEIWSFAPPCVNRQRDTRRRLVDGFHCIDSHDYLLKPKIKNIY